MTIDRTKWMLLLFGVGLLVIASGCSLLGGSSSSTGTLSMSLTDAPAADLKEVNVTITKVEVHRSAGWEVLNTFDNGFSVNLLDLRFDEALLGQQSLPAGAYTQIRLHVDDSSQTLSNVVEKDGSTHYLKVPSGSETGLKINYSFTVPQGGTTSLIMDANVLEFVSKAGNTGDYLINPTAIRVVDRTASGTISGKVVDGSGNAITTTDVYISLFWDSNNDGQADDYNGDGSFSSEDDYVAQSVALHEAMDSHAAGEFQLNAVPVLSEGSYIIVVSAEGYNDFSQAGLQVSAGENTQVDGDLNTDSIQDITLTQ